MTDQPTAIPSARVRPASSWSAIWVLPIIALLIGGWLGWKAYNEQGVAISIRFTSGDGIVAGKTELIFKGIPLGKVDAVLLDQKDHSVSVHVEVDRHAESFLRKDTKFWLVQPRVSLAGVTGLETLVSGNYITLLPGEGERTTSFQALTVPPPLADKLPGLHVQLVANKLGSLDEGSPVYYKQIQVGQVTSYKLQTDQEAVLINVNVNPEYASLVHTNTRFWNAGGLSVKADLSGVQIQMESAISLMAGGIAFDTPDDGKERVAATSNQSFKLFNNFDDAQVGIKLKVFLPDFEGLIPGKSEVRWQGITVGTLTAAKVSPDLNGVYAELSMEPRTEPYLTENLRLWLVKPKASLGGLSGLDALVKGNYIAIDPGTPGKPQKREFTALSQAPAPDFRTPGLHLLLTADKTGSLEAGSPLLYRQLVVGSIESVELADDRQHILLRALVNPEYQYLVNRSSRFWNASGVTVSGGLSGLQIKSESLQSLLAGGVAFDTPQRDARGVGNGQNFILYADQDSATLPATQIELQTLSGEGLKAGTPVRYKGMDVGKVTSLKLAADLQAINLQIDITQGGDNIARQGTQFTVIRPQVGLTKMANLDTLITGPYIEVTPTSNPQAPRETHFQSKILQKVAQQQEAGLTLTLTTEQRRSLKEGMPVSYRGMAVGKVTGLKLSPDAASVLIGVQIDPPFTKLVHRGSRFWNVSGINVDFSLFKGAKVRTDSVESLLEGSIAFATPDDASQGPQAVNGSTFELHEQANDEWPKWRPRIAIGEPGR